MVGLFSNSKCDSLPLCVWESWISSDVAHHIIACTIKQFLNSQFHRAFQISTYLRGLQFLIHYSKT